MGARKVELERVQFRDIELYEKQLVGEARCEELILKHVIKNRWDMAKMVRRFTNLKKLELFKVDKYLMVTIMKELEMSKITHFVF